MGSRPKRDNDIVSPGTKRLNCLFFNLHIKFASFGRHDLMHPLREGDLQLWTGSESARVWWKLFEIGA